MVRLGRNVARLDVLICHRFCYLHMVDRQIRKKKRLTKVSVDKDIMDVEVHFVCKSQRFYKKLRTVVKW